MCQSPNQCSTLILYFKQRYCGFSKKTSNEKGRVRRIEVSPYKFPRQWVFGIFTQDKDRERKSGYGCQKNNIRRLIWRAALFNVTSKKNKEKTFATFEIRV